MLKSSNPKTHVLNLRSRDRSKKIGQLNHKGSNQPKPTHTPADTPKANTVIEDDQRSTDDTNQKNKG